MTRFVAVLVEDSDQDASETRSAIELAGFDVLRFSDAAAALVGIRAQEPPIDLLVLDRRLPVRHGDVPSDGAGDELLLTLLDEYPDVKIIVFSGYSDEKHIQFATDDRGSITLRMGDINFSRVTALGKGQSLEFDSHLRTISQCLEAMEDIELIIADGADDNALTKRLLRRVAYEFEAGSISARPLAGGLSDAPVWLCEITDSSGRPSARVVVKQQRRRLGRAGLHSLLPAGATAGVTDQIGGFCGGALVSLQQVAGDSPVSIMSLIAEDPAAAAAARSRVQAILDVVTTQTTVMKPIADVVAHFGDWETLRRRADELGITPPSGSRMCTTVDAPQHGDLHPGNALVVDGQPILIDFDAGTTGSELIDAVLLALAPLFHSGSQIRELPWPTDDQLRNLFDESFLVSCPAPEYFRGAVAWLETRSRSPRELYAVVFAYALRQLKYEDVRASPLIKRRAVALASWAAEQLEAT